MVGFDPDAFDELGECFGTNDCFFGTTDLDGQFSLTATFLSGFTLYASAFAIDGSTYRFYNGSASFSSCPSVPVTITADHYSLDFFIGTMEDVDTNTVGSVNIINGQASVVFVLGTTFYSAVATDGADKPTQLGTWLTLDLLKLSSNGTVQPAGSVTFTVTSLSPIGGTWNATGSGLSASGTWADALP